MGAGSHRASSAASEDVQEAAEGEALRRLVSAREEMLSASMKQYNAADLALHQASIEAWGTFVADMISIDAARNAVILAADQGLAQEGFVGWPAAL